MIKQKYRIPKEEANNFIAPLRKDSRYISRKDSRYISFVCFNASKGAVYHVGDSTIEINPMGKNITDGGIDLEITSLDKRKLENTKSKLEKITNVKLVPFDSSQIFAKSLGKTAFMVEY